MFPIFQPITINNWPEIHEKSLYSEVNKNIISKMSPHSEIALQKFIHDHSISLMALQETGNWLPTNGLYSKQKVIQNKCINDQAGVALIVDKKLNPEHIDTIEDDTVDAAWCQMKLKNKRILIGSVYRPIQADRACDSFLKL